jgi:hypothetical protein
VEQFPPNPLTKTLKPPTSDPLASGSRSEAFHPKSVSRRTPRFNRYAQGTTQQRPSIVSQGLTLDVAVRHFLRGMNPGVSIGNYSPQALWTVFKEIQF